MYVYIEVLFCKYYEYARWSGWGYIFESKCAYKCNEMVLNELVSFDSCFESLKQSVCVNQCQNLQFSLRRARLA